MSMGSWLDDLLDLLCRIYRLLGGDCSDFEGDGHKATELVIKKNAEVGPPKFSSPSALEAFLKTLDELQYHLSLPENSLSKADTDALLNLIAELRKNP